VLVSARLCLGVGADSLGNLGGRLKTALSQSSCVAVAGVATEMCLSVARGCPLREIDPIVCCVSRQHSVGKDVGAARSCKEAGGENRYPNMADTTA
jgi:hypothetical protein